MRASWDAEDYTAPVLLLSADIQIETTHRDVLGSLLATGIKRDQLGDILVFEDKVFVFVLEEMATYLSSNLEKIGDYNCKAQIQKIDQIELPTPSFRVEHCVLASLRLDNVVAKACKLSRSEAGEILSRSQVKLDHEIRTKGTILVTNGSLVSVRGYGRFLFYLEDGLTKKGKQKSQIHWYK